MKLGCMTSGPIVIGPEEDKTIYIVCNRVVGDHVVHRWISDDGSVKIEWQDKFSFLVGQWRNDVS